jgi:hypothetical protein
MSKRSTQENVFTKKQKTNQTSSSLDDLSNLPDKEKLRAVGTVVQLNPLRDANTITSLDSTNYSVSIVLKDGITEVTTMLTGNFTNQAGVTLFNMSSTDYHLLNEKAKQNKLTDLEKKQYKNAITGCIGKTFNFKIAKSGTAYFVNKVETISELHSSSSSSSSASSLPKNNSNENVKSTYGAES